MRTYRFRVELHAIDQAVVSGRIYLPHHQGIEWSATWTEAELWKWIRSTVKKYLREQTRASARVRSRRVRESR